MTLVADRFIRFDDGTVRDLATGGLVTLIEITLTDRTAQIARRDRCLARLDAQARGGGEVEHDDVGHDSHGPPEDLALVDFALVGESLWIEAYRTASEAAMSRDERVITKPVVDAIAATLDGLGSRDLRRLYVKAPDDAGLDTFRDDVAREIRARGFVPLSTSFVHAWPGIAPLLKARSIVLFGDARCGVGGFTVARAIGLLHRAASVIAAIVARVRDHVNVAALRLMPAAVATPRAASVSRTRAVRGVVSVVSEPDLPVRAESAWPPQSVLRPAVAVSYADPNLPSLFPRTEQVAQVAETAETSALAWFAVDERANEGASASSEEAINEVDPERAGVINEGRAFAAGPGPLHGDAAARFDETESGDAFRYPPLRLVERRIRSEPVEDAAADIPVVTTMVSGYGDAVDALVGRGRWAAASRALRAELAAHERRQQRHAGARTSIALGRLHLAMGEVGQATRWFNRAGELASAWASGAVSGPGGSGSGQSESDQSESGQTESGGSGHVNAKLIGEALRWSGIAALDDADLERSERLLRSALAAIGPEADPHQLFAIELSLARCLFWQGRAREIVLPSASTDCGDAFDGARRAPGRDPMSSVILRAERWRRAARLALADGDLSRAGDATARACRLARGDEEEDVRSAGCCIEAPAGIRARTRKEQSTDARIREALRAACHLDAARLQFAIGDTSSGDAHLRACLALSRVPARTARVQLLQLARSRSDRTSEGGRRFARLSAALRQPRMPRLVRIQARYLVDPRSRRPLELATFLDRHGDAALAGHGHADRRGGGSPMLEAFQDVLRICHETPDDLTALARVSAFLRDQLRATSVAIYGTPPVVRFAVSGSTRLLAPELAARAIDAGLMIPPTYQADALDAAVPVRYGGEPIGAIVVRWSIDATLDHTNASALIGAAAAAVSPHVRAALDRERPDEDTTAADGRAPARTLGLLGVSPALDTLRQTITRVASAPFHVLIEGESGSGKELVARALHQHGPRRHRRFCAVNCAALTDELLEAELFGHTRGAFTGALTERAGLFEEADGGTLFLDEIGELSPRGQAKLLRVIQDGETRRIGENLPRRVDTRIVAATNRSLRQEADAGQFRGDLLYRLDVIRITVPPLRARPEDVVVLARAFWDEAIARLGSRATLDPGTLAVLARYHWPGNVRELHNAIMALAVHAPPRGRVTPSLLPSAIRARPADVSSDDATAGRETEREPLEIEGPLEDAKRAFESRYIRAALARAGGSPSRAARSLGLTRQGLAKLIARLGLDDDVATRASTKRSSDRKGRPPP